MADKTSASLLKIYDVTALTKKCRSSIYNMEASGEFPSRIMLGPRSVAWRAVEVHAWIESRPIASPIKAPSKAVAQSHKPTKAGG
jgi:prophage regulatory protein